MSGEAFDVVDQFEAKLAEFTGAPMVVAVASCTWAIFLAMRYCLRHQWQTSRWGLEVEVPRYTFISVPMAVLMAGCQPKIVSREWQGCYQLNPLNVIDSALQFNRGMYQPGSLQCISFHSRKILHIGRGGAILTDDAHAYEWLRAARYCGRKKVDGYKVASINSMGWQAYMLPEEAARGMLLMEYIGDGEPDQEQKYPDLLEVEFFKERHHAK